MYNLYLYNNTGIPVTHLQTDNIYEIAFMLKDEAKKLDPNSDNYVLISLKELPTYQVKGINE